MKMSAPNCCLTGSQAFVQTKLRPKSWIAGQARSKTFQAIRPSSAAATADAATATPRKRMSPRRLPRRRRSVSGAAASYVVTQWPRSGARLDLLDLAVGVALHLLRERDEPERRTELLAPGEGPEDESPQSRRFSP